MANPPDPAREAAEHLWKAKFGYDDAKIKERFRQIVAGYLSRASDEAYTDAVHDCIREVNKATANELARAVIDACHKLIAIRSTPSASEGEVGK